MVWGAAAVRGPDAGCKALNLHNLTKTQPNKRSTNKQIKTRGMHTILRDASTSKNDFVFYADRLNRLVVEHGLGHLPFAEKTVVTPTGACGGVCLGVVVGCVCVCLVC